MNMWQGIGVLVGLYTLISVLRGEVHGKRGVSMETIYRQHAPGQFWLTIVIYGALTVALFTVF